MDERNNSMTMVKTWVITPHESFDFDCCLIPVREIEDHNKALDYAKSVMERLWDEAGFDGCPDQFCVSMKLTEYSEEDLAEALDGD